MTRTRSARDRGDIDVDILEIDRDRLMSGLGTSPLGWRVSSHPTGNIVYLVLLPNRPALRSPEVRRGVQLSIDRNALARTVYGETARVPRLASRPRAGLGRRTRNPFREAWPTRQICSRRSAPLRI